MTGQPNIRNMTLVWGAGLDPLTQHEIQDMFNVKVFNIPTDPDKILNIRAATPEVIITGESIPQEEREEIIQIIALKFNQTPMYHIIRDIKKFDLPQAISKGYKDIFLLPYERTVFEELMIQRLADQETPVKQVFNQIRLMDLDPNRPITFDLNLYLKANRKFICLLKKGAAIGQARMQKIQSQMSFCYVSQQDMDSFHSYVQQGLSHQSPPQDASATDRRVKLKTTVSKLFREFFNQSKKFPSSTANIEKLIGEVKDQIRGIVAQTTFDNWYKRFLEYSGDRIDQGYNHACNVGLTAGFISMSTGIGKPEDVALAGILHDIGIAFIAEEAQEKDFLDMNENQQSIYRTHVQKAVNEITTKNLNLHPNVVKAVSQHHEVFSGKGYPAKVAGKNLIPEAQIISLADRLDELTSFTVDRAAVSPFDAIKAIHSAEEAGGALGRLYEPKFFQTVLDTFMESRNNYLKTPKAG
jgi:HD-GYP domain-containing protein (c-di-GMP phosphodiesterase class II)